MSEPGEIPTPEEAKAETPPVAAVREAVEETQKQQMEKVLVDIPMPGERGSGVNESQKKQTVYKAWMESFSKVQKAVEEQGGKISLAQKVEMRLYAAGRQLSAGTKDLFWNVVNYPARIMSKISGFMARLVLPIPFLNKFIGKGAEKASYGITVGTEKVLLGKDPRTYRQQEIAHARKYLKQQTGERVGFEKIVDKILGRVGGPKK